MAMSRRGTLWGMKDLTPAQNARITAAIVALQQKKDMSTTEVAQLIGRSQPSLSNNLSGKNGFSWETARRCAKLLSTTLDELVGPESPRPGEKIEVPAVMTPRHYLAPEEAGRQMFLATQAWRGPHDKALADRFLADPDNRSFSGMEGKSPRAWEAMYEERFEAWKRAQTGPPKAPTEKRGPKAARR